MIITQFQIHNFRNISHADVTPSPFFNFIIGENGSGKTSFLEALYTIGHGRAFRQSLSSRIIEHGQQQLVLFSQLKSQNEQLHTIGLSKSRSGDNNIKIDGNEHYKLADLAKLLPMQLITPEGFDLLIGGPKYRRAFIDWGCFHHYPEFLGLWNNLRKLIKQRNVLLKEVTHYQQLSHWDKELIPISHKISEIREDYIKKIEPNLIQTTHDFLPEYTLECQYYQGWDPEFDYAQVLKQNFERDKILSYTQLGPQKADLKLKADGIPIEILFSRGQLKLAICALRLAQGEFFSEKTSQPCLYLIDDFASELDNNKQNLLSARLKSTNAQVFISSLDESQIQSISSQNDKIFHIKSGIISE